MANVGALLVTAILGALLGWFLHSRRCAKEKMAVSDGWQHQVDAQRVEHERIATQNSSLMEQISQHQASGKDIRKRANDLTTQLKIALGNSNDLQRKLKESRSNLAIAVAQRDKLNSRLESGAARQDTALGEKDEKIARLKRELGKWQERIPPLVERYRLRDLEAQELELELSRAQERIGLLEAAAVSQETRIEPIGNGPLTDLNASNDQYDDTMELDTGNLGTNGNASGDDLKRIKGIGPAIEKTLNALGFSRFSQIATMSEYDIDRVASELRGFKSRIHREDWIGQARTLQHENRRDPA
ncbi:MAG: hypothetical protein RIA65_13990 [Woeseia sp.]